MGKYLIACAVVLASPIFGSQFRVRVAPMETFQETGGLPPQLHIKVLISCWEKLLRGLREDTTASDGTVIVSVGALVLSDSFNPCSQGPALVDVPLGTTFSGRPYEVDFIRPLRRVNCLPKSFSAFFPIGGQGKIELGSCARHLCRTSPLVACITALKRAEVSSGVPVSAVR